jgi:hypothetical protein
LAEGLDCQAFARAGFTLDEANAEVGGQVAYLEEQALHRGAATYHLAQGPAGALPEGQRRTAQNPVCFWNVSADASHRASIWRPREVASDTLSARALKT